MIRIGFVGVPGSGKTSTARGLAAFCRGDDKLKSVELVHEYARRYIAKYGTIDTVQDQYRVLQKQLDWEDSIPKGSTDIMITDSPVHLGFLYVMELRKCTHKDTVFVNDIFKKMNTLNVPPRYDIIFYLPPRLKPVQDGVRDTLHFDEEWRSSADQTIRNIFTLFPPGKFIEINSMPMEDRIEECLGHLRTLIQSQQ
ncbi:MAG: hypothetical protein D4S01_09725 [Dehalococcoidia bacterium]|nr:MAG: hypothetical protein D4S01_09725 [Dehalococcoidia bacterium]